MKKELEVAREAAEAAGRHAIRSWKKNGSFRTKNDGSPVTEADIQAERILKDALRSEFPDDGVLGEESGETLGVSGRRWIIDPIDGTRDFMRGTDSWAVLLALEEIATQAILVGAVHFPAREQSFWAVKGSGAFHDGEAIMASRVDLWANAMVHVNNLACLPSDEHAVALSKWLKGCLGVRNLGGAVDAMMVASGKADAWIDWSAQPWDLAPLRVVLEEAGAIFAGSDGISSIYSGKAIAYTPGLESKVEYWRKAAAI